MGQIFAKEKKLPKQPISLSCRELYNIQNDLRSYFVLIDVRHHSHFDNSHIDMAVNIQSVKEMVLAATENQYRTATILYGDSDLSLIAKELAKAVSDVEDSDQKRTIQDIMYLSESFDDYHKLYNFMCTADSDYSEGRLYPSQVDNDVFLSNYGVASNPDVISILGITHVVNCTIDCPFVDTSNELETKIEDNIHTHQIKSTVGCSVPQKLRVPVVDDQDQQICDHFQTALEFIQNALNSVPDMGFTGIEKNRVLVHCKHGQSRSATVLAAWLIKHRGHTVDSSIAFLKSCRPKVGPNEGFLNQLRVFAKSLEDEKI